MNLVRTRTGTSAFTLLEVMIAVMIFFMCMFSILALVSGSLSHVRAFQQTTVNPGSLAAKLSLTNALEEGTIEGNFGDMYPGYRWRQDTTAAGTNGLFAVHFTVYKSGVQNPESELSMFKFAPQSRQGIGR